MNIYILGMDEFYFYTIAIALIILILMLTMIGITLSYGNELKVYPPIQPNCPDYWVQATDNDTIMGNTKPDGSKNSNDYCIFPTNNGTNKGSTNGDLNIVTNWIDVSNTIGGNIVSSKNGLEPKIYVQMNGNDDKWTSLYPGVTVRCAKQKWALDRGIVWDGVTNFNGCTSSVV